MENKIDISVIIPMYNSEEYIENAINSILSQDEHGLNYEIIIIDDGSKDNTLEIVKNLKNERIRLIELKKNTGTANSRNVGIQLAKGEWIQFVDSDDRICADLYKKFELSIKPDFNCYVFSLQIENYYNILKRTITKIKDKRAIGYFYSVCTMFLKRKICLEFKKEYSFEDVCFIFDTMKVKDLKISLIEDAYYLYNCKNEQSKMANFNKKEYRKMYSYIYNGIEEADDLTKMFFLETFVGIVFSKGMPFLMSLGIAIKTLFKLYGYIPRVYSNGIRNSIMNTAIYDNI